MAPERIEALDLDTFGEVSDGPGPSGVKVSAPPPGHAETKEKDCGPFVLSDALPVVPAKLAKKIRRGEFVDMSELLKDNMEVERRRAAQGGEGGHQAAAVARVDRREVPDLLSWLHCFSLYAAIVCKAHPNKVSEMWAYQATLIGEARRCGGRGWLLYDSAFRQQIVSLESTDFGKINQSLYATTFLAYGGRGQFCSSCMLPDHSREDCALHPGRNLPVVRLGDVAERRFRPDQRRGKSGGKRPCFAWNDGRCSLPYCRFEHICSRCHGNHRRDVCKAREETGDSSREEHRGKKA